MRPREREVVLLAAMGTILAPLNSTMMAIALPTIAGALGIGEAQGGWLITGYLIGMLLLLFPSGMLGDRVGRRIPVLIGLIGFAVTALAAATHAFLPLLAFRILQAVCAALVIPNVTAVLRRTVPGERRALAFGMVGSVASASAALGPVLAGLLIHLFGWPSIFLCNLVFIAPAFVLALRVLPARSKGAERPVSAAGAGAPGEAQVAGTTAGEADTDVPWTARVHWRAFLTANLGTSITNLGMYSAMVAVPWMLALRPDWTTAQTGLVLLALSGGSVILAPIGGRWADRRGRREPVILGVALAAIGLALIAWNASSLDVLIVGLAAVGFGIGFASTTLRTVANETVHGSLAGQAAAASSAARYVGSITATLVLTHLAAGSGYSGLFLVEAITTLALLVFVRNIPGRRQRQARGTPPAAGAIRAAGGE